MDKLRADQAASYQRVIVIGLQPGERVEDHEHEAHLVLNVQEMPPNLRVAIEQMFQGAFYDIAFQALDELNTLQVLKNRIRS